MTRPGASPKAVILVGGQGTRLQPLTFYMPKPMVPVLNRPFLEYTIAYLKRHGINDIVLALSYLPDTIQGYFGEGQSLGVRMAYTVEASPLGTAGAVKNARAYLDGTFVVLNGDIFSEINIRQLVEFHRKRQAKATIALTWVDNPSAFGVVETDVEGRVKAFIEKPSPGTETTNWINAGVYVLEPEVMEHVPSGSYYMFERGLFPLLLSRNEPVYGYPFRGYWLDMGTVGKYLRLNNDLLMRLAPSPLGPELDQDRVLEGKGVEIDALAVVEGPVVIGPECRVGKRACIKGPVVLGAGCDIGEGALVKDSVIWERVRIGAGARLEGCFASSGTRIGEGQQFVKKVITRDYGCQELD